MNADLVRGIHLTRVLSLTEPYNCVSSVCFLSSQDGAHGAIETSKSSASTIAAMVSSALVGDELASLPVVAEVEL